MLLNICNSSSRMKSKKVVGISAKRAAIPAVNAKLTYTYFIFRFSKSGSSNSFFNVSTAKNGIVNSAITRMDATVRNFEYIGK